MKSSEDARLDIVKKFELLNFNNNKELNDLVTLAIEICNVPIALITLMGEDVQWIKVRSGINIDRNSREDSFCKYLINKTEVMVVQDTKTDERFADNPAVKGAFGIRFYAGAPLITSDGYHLGSLCLLDQQPRTFSAKEKELLAILSRQVMHMMELQMSVKMIEQQNEELIMQRKKTIDSEQKLKAFFNSSDTCYVLISMDFEILYFNKATEHFIYKTSGQKIKNGKNIFQVIDALVLDEFVPNFTAALEGKGSNEEVLITDNQDSLWWNLSFVPVKDKQNKIFSVAIRLKNIDEQKKQLVEIVTQNESLLEIAHIQSHEYRKPLASILGLINVVKADDYKAEIAWFNMLEKSAHDLDERLKKVITFSENGLIKPVPKEAISKTHLVINKKLVLV